MTAMLAAEAARVLNECAQFGGRDPGQRPDLAVEVRLVAVP
jgi:hypothetical protein